MVQVPLHGPEVLLSVAGCRDDLESDEPQGVEYHGARARQPDPVGGVGRGAPGTSLNRVVMLQTVGELALETTKWEMSTLVDTINIGSCNHKTVGSQSSQN